MFGLGKKKKNKPHITDMAGPETDRGNLRYNPPLPVKQAPIYYGGKEYQAKHAEGFSEEEHERAYEQALRDFNSNSVGTGRVQDWEGGVPFRNRQGQEGELKGITTSAPTTDPARARIFKDTGK